MYQPFVNAPWIQVEPAQGYPVWRFRPDKSFAVLAGTGHPCDNTGTNCYFGLLNEDGALVCNSQQLLWATVAGDAERLNMPGGVGYCYDEHGKEIQYCLAVAMYGPGSSFSPQRGERGPHIASIVGNSDIVSGMGLRLNAHDQYALWFELQTSADDEPPLPPDTETIVGNLYRVKKANANRLVLVRELEPARTLEKE